MRRQIILLILITTALRLAFAATTGLGVDESYMVAAGRVLSLGYFDHPPAAWWLSWAFAHLFGSEAPIVVRLPFILLFALTTWLMARLGEAMGYPRAGFWAAVTLNLSPVFGVTSGTWVLPDGPLDAALTGAALCLVHALPARDRWGYWCGAGVCAGLALFSKYSAVLVVAGAFVFLVWHLEYRVWLRRWQPYAAGAIALLIFSGISDTLLSDPSALKASLILANAITAIALSTVWADISALRRDSSRAARIGRSSPGPTPRTFPRSPTSRILISGANPNSTNKSASGVSPARKSAPWVPSRTKTSSQTANPSGP